MKYDYKAVEAKWQKVWEDEKTFHVEIDHKKPKFYALVEFPYPSGAGLHVGHPRSYTALDVVSRKRRQNGYPEECVAAAVEYGSLNRAAEKLYTTQPNVSRVLNSLEKELHVTLLERSNKGIKMTPQGEELYGHAMSILKHSNVIRSMSERPNGRRFSVSGYRSGLLTKLMVQLYQGFLPFPVLLFL